ncbi:MAG TPA: hypothetical protein VHA54_00635 [Solirubrobacterales bacterium]|nr:hypothetical protein [Solirubrobacterales bacterium]
MSLDADPEALQSLQRRFDINGISAKATLQDPRVSELDAWRSVACSTVARAQFQEGFTALDRERRGAFSATHDALAEMLHRGLLAHIVSLNWDTQLEAAWIARYGQLETLRARLTKPHGNASNPAERWVLPGETAPLPPSLLARLEAMATERPRVLVVVGYSERDEQVVGEMIAPLEERWNVIRIGPDATAPSSLRGSAEVVLPQLRDAIEAEAEAPGWAYVNFEQQHELGWALSGRRLGPQDVEACPKAPEVSQVISELETTGAATIIGPSGSGKSLAAAQAAFAFWKRGVEVVMLQEVDLDQHRLTQSLVELPRPVIAIVDDAQRLGSSQLEALSANGGNDLWVLAVVNEADPTSPGVRLDPEATVDLLARHIRERSEELLPVITKLDPQIGDGYLDEPLARRLRQAQRAAKTPWHFTYILTGGWRRIRGELAELRRENGHDLLVGLVAIIQEARLDGIAEGDELVSLAKVAGREAEWTEAALVNAEHHRLIVREGRGYRLPHLRFCEAVFRSILGGPARKGLLACLASAIEDRNYSLAGIFWLLRAFRFAEEPWRREEHLAESTAVKLATRCWKGDLTEAGEASLVLEALGISNPGIVELKEHADVAATWISAASPESMYGLARLINSAYNDDPGILEGICAQIERPKLIRAFERAGWPDAYLFGELFDRLALGPASFCDQVKQEIDRDAFRALLGAWPEADESELYLVSKVLRGLAGFDLELAIEQIEELANPIAERWQNDFSAGYSELMDIQFLLGFGPHFLRRRKPRASERRIMRKICQALDPEAVATQISRSKRREWTGIGEGLYLIQEVSRPLAEKIATSVDLHQLDKSTAPFWAERFGELGPLLIGLAASKDSEPAASWLTAHLPQMERVDTLAAQMAPDACVARLQETGGTLDLSSATLRWGFTALALNDIAELDLELARRSVAEHAQSLANSFVDAALDDEAQYLLKLLIEVAPDEFRTALSSVDPAKARAMWTKTLRARRRGPCRAVAILLEFLLSDADDIPLRQLALDLREKFPATTSSTVS